jgi:electron transfer flavoprotein alpha subunit
MLQKAASELPLVKKVISVEAAHYENFLAENFAPVVLQACR